MLVLFASIVPWNGLILQNKMLSIVKGKSHEDTAYSFFQVEAVKDFLFLLTPR